MKERKDYCDKMLKSNNVHLLNKSSMGAAGLGSYANRENVRHDDRGRSRDPPNLPTKWGTCIFKGLQRNFSI